MINLFKRKRVPIIDIKIVDGEKTLYYLKWFKGVGFLPMSKEGYEKRYVSSEVRE